MLEAELQQERIESYRNKEQRKELHRLMDTLVRA